MNSIKSLFRKKPIIFTPTSDLYRCLSAWDLALLGIGAIIGAGIFILTGIVAATKAGPGVVLSLIFAGTACGCSALAYAELAASIGGCGSAYSYSYASFGELLAWIIGWDLLLEYGVSCPTVAIGWSGYTNNILTALGLYLPAAITKSPFEGGYVNLPAVFIIFIMTLLLALGIKQSSRFNNVVVFIKLFVIGIFIAVASPHFNLANWHPFLPFGIKGVIQGAGLIFFAYIGFDAVSTAVEEAKQPERDIPIGIIAALIVCTVVYIVVAGLLTGITHYSNLNVSSPVAHVLLMLHYRFAAGIVAIGAIAGLTTVILVMYYGFTRVFLAMARDGLLPPSLAVIHSSTKTPVRIIFMVGIVMMAIAGLLPISEVAELVNIGTLSAFTFVCLGVVVLRYTQPDLPRPFKIPWSPVIPLLGAILSLSLMLGLAKLTWIRLFVWMIIGLLIYYFYSRHHSVLQLNANANRCHVKKQ
jgi:APA family basic amino acid/polyamine antiporter